MGKKCKVEQVKALQAIFLCVKGGWFPEDHHHGHHHDFKLRHTEFLKDYFDGCPEVVVTGCDDYLVIVLLFPGGEVVRFKYSFCSRKVSIFVYDFCEKIFQDLIENFSESFGAKRNQYAALKFCE